MMLLYNIHLGFIAAFCLTAFAGTSARSSSDFVFGECQPGKDKCRDCYISLAQALFQSDENVFNLSKAFFPPDTNTPEFVAVRYHLRSDSGKDTVLVWFWAASASYFLYPLATFQFLSLFFGKPEVYWTATVDVTLNATECEGMKQQHLTILTQRLKIYVEQYDIRPSIDDMYQAEAINDIQLDEIFNQNAHQLTTIVICVQTLVVVMILLSIIVIVSCAQKSNGRGKLCINKIKHKPTIAKQSLLISFSFNGMLFLLYTVALDSAAIYYRNKSLISDLKLIHHSDTSGRPFDILYNIPVVVLVFDLIAAVGSITMLLVVFIHFCYKGRDSDGKGYSLISLTSSFLGPLIALITHSPFMAIAYINDAYYAGSIFVYYIVVFFVCFSAIHVTMYACLGALLVQRKHSIWSCLFRSENDLNANSRIASCKLLCPVVVIFLMIILLLFTVAVVICYFVIIPLNGSVSDAPHQLIGFYQSIIIFLGVFITYKTILHKKYDGLKGAIKNLDTSPVKNVDNSEWKDLPNEEKSMKFYEMIIDLVKYYNNKREGPITATGGGVASTAPSDGGGMALTGPSDGGGVALTGPSDGGGVALTGASNGEGVAPTASTPNETSMLVAETRFNSGETNGEETTIVLSKFDSAGANGNDDATNEDDGMDLPLIK